MLDYQTSRASFFSGYARKGYAEYLLLLGTTYTPVQPWPSRAN